MVLTYIVLQHGEWRRTCSFLYETSITLTHKLGKDNTKEGEIIDQFYFWMCETLKVLVNRIQQCIEKNKMPWTSGMYSRSGRSVHCEETHSYNIYTILIDQRRKSLSLM